MLTQFAFALSADFFQGQEQVFKIRLKIYDIFSSNLLDQDAIDNIDWQSQNMLKKNLSLSLLLLYIRICAHVTFNLLLVVSSQREEGVTSNNFIE